MTRGLVASIRASVHAAVATHGFRRKGQLSTRHANGLVNMMGVQSSTSSTSVQATVTVNLAIWCEALAHVRPSIWDVHWRMRIGEVMPNRSDVCWSLNRANASVTALQVADAVTRYGIPTLDRISTPTDLRTLWVAGSSPGLTAMQRSRYLIGLSEAQT